jgi:pyruvate dehydrogenase E1 component alpha subunit
MTKELNAKFRGQSKEQLLKLYYDMLLIRRLEEKSGQLYGMGKIAGFCHLYIGQEAVVTGIQTFVKEGDSIITGYRDHGHMLACGMDSKGVLAELMGRVDGLSKGKGGSMHMFSREKGFYGGHGIVGAQGPLGTGLALAHQYENDGGMVFAYFGDGAANQGQIYEAYNMASLWKLPVLYIVENNQYGMGTSVERHSCTKNFYSRGAGFNIPGALVNGMDVFDVQEATEKAVDHVRSGKGPYILEFQTYRYKGHSMSDPAKYRTKEEVESYRLKNDPLSNCERDLLTHKICTEEDFKTIEKQIKDILKEAVDFSEASPEPGAHELYTDILIEG